MNLSKTKIGAFFIAIVLLGWFLYPQELFLAYISEGQAELQVAEKHYLKYLANHPHSKKAVLRLADLYYRMAEPEKATPLYEDLFNHRKKDWGMAQLYLDHFENLGDGDLLCSARIAVADRFFALGNVDRRNLAFLYDSAIEHLLWRQRYDEAYLLLLKLTEMKVNRQAHVEQILDLERGQHNTDRLTGFLMQEIKKTPDNLYLREELASVLLVNGKYDEARKQIDQLLAIKPSEVGYLRLKYNLVMGLKSYEEAIGILESLITLTAVSEGEKSGLWVDLGYTYLLAKKTDKALALFDKLLAGDPKSERLWNLVFGLVNDLNDKQVLADYLERYLKQFPDSQSHQKQLVQLWLYDFKDLSKTNDYLAYAKKYGDFDLAADVGFAFVAAKRQQEACVWWQKLLEVFPGEPRVLVYLIDALMAENNLQTALVFAERFLATHPGDVRMMRAVAGIYTKLKMADQAELVWKRLAGLKPRDFEVQLEVGRELLFLDCPDPAKKHFLIARELRPHEPEPWFWLSEIAVTNADEKGAVSDAREFLAYLGSGPPPQERWHRMWLKARVRVADLRGLYEDYTAAVAHWPRSEGLRIDYIDFLVNHSGSHLGQKELERFAADFGADREDVRSLKAVLSMRKRHWRDAIVLYRDLFAHAPTTWSYGMGLAEAYEQAGDWPEAIAGYENIQKKTGNRFGLLPRLLDLHEEHDHTVFGDFAFTSLGADQFSTLGMGYHGYQTKKLKTFGKVLWGQFDLANAGFSGDMLTGQAGISYFSGQSAKIHVGVTGGISEARTVPGAQLDVVYRPMAKLSLSTELSYQALRHDLSQAVQFGAVNDSGKFGFEWGPVKRFIFSGGYTLTRTRLVGGAESIGQNLDPAVVFVVSQKPYITFGYRFVYGHQSDDGVFFTQVPLIADARTHYLTAYGEQRFSDRLLISGHAFVGEDTARNLSLFKGDLFGFGLHFKWHVLSWASLAGGYQYGRETLAGIGGESHQVSLQVNGHWR